ncbi:MAG TPA: hypothetical protein VJX92_18945 [Methylomirabilota bacterium]|nr:hypothetical protein [Methylomirabilota bacterium]
MQALAPIAVSAADFDVALVPDGIAAAISPGSVRSANESPFALQCSIGPDRHWLQPWSVDVWPVHGSTVMHVHPVALASPVNPAPFSNLLVTVAQPYETIPGTYPASLDRQSTPYGQQPVIGTITTVGNGDTVNNTFPVPTGTLGIQFICQAASGFFLPQEVRVQGDVSGVTYLDDFQNVTPFAADMGRWIPPDQNAVCKVVSQTGPGLPAKVTFVALTFCPTLNVRASTNTPVNVSNATTLTPLVGSTTTLAATYKQILATQNNLRLYYARFDIDAASGGVFAVGVDGVTAGVFGINDNGKGPYVIGPFGGGEFLGSSAGLWVFTTNASTVRFHVAYQST